VKDQRLGGTLALAAGGTLLGALVLETGVRWLSPQLPPHAGLYRADPVLGFRQVAFFDGRFGAPERAVAVRTNSHGFRDREYPPKASSLRILGLGDSFTFGFGVEEGETFLALVEGALREGAVEVINAGLVGGGPESAARLLEVEGPRLGPDLVVLGFYAGNDLLDALLGSDGFEVREGSLFWRPGEQERWESVVEPGRLVRTARPPRALDHWKAFLRKRSHLYRLTSRLYATGRGRVEDAGCASVSLFQEEAFCLRRYPAELEDGWRAAAAAFERIKAWCGRNGSTLAFVIIPFRGQVEEDAWRAFLACHRVDADDFDREKPQRLVKGWADGAGVPLLDLLPALRVAAQEPGDLYYRGDPHWTPRAHALAAREILATLRERGLLRASGDQAGRDSAAAQPTTKPNTR
jgi:hypothetical protein